MDNVTNFTLSESSGFLKIFILNTSRLKFHLSYSCTLRPLASNVDWWNLISLPTLIIYTPMTFSPKYKISLFTHPISRNENPLWFKWKIFIFLINIFILPVLEAVIRSKWSMGVLGIRNFELSLNKDKDWLHTKQDCKAICWDILW